MGDPEKQETQVRTKKLKVPEGAVLEPQRDPSVKTEKMSLWGDWG